MKLKTSVTRKTDLNGTKPIPGLYERVNSLGVGQIVWFVSENSGIVVHNTSDSDILPVGWYGSFIPCTDAQWKLFEGEIKIVQSIDP